MQIFCGVSDPDLALQNPDTNEIGKNLHLFTLILILNFSKNVPFSTTVGTKKDGQAGTDNL
jgi:hypothetical protein